MNATFLSEQYLQVVPTELLMAFSMSMKGSGSLMLNPEKQRVYWIILINAFLAVEQKLHWTFKLYDKVNLDLPFGWMFHMLPPGWQRWDWSGRNGRDFYVGFFYFFSTGFQISHFQETLQDSARNRRRPKRNSGQGEGEREGSGGKEEQKGGGKGVGADEKKTPLWLQRTSLLQQKDDKVSFLGKNSNKKCLNDCPEPRNPFFPSLEFSDWWRKNFKWEEILWKLWR